MAKQKPHAKPAKKHKPSKTPETEPTLPFETPPAAATNEPAPNVHVPDPDDAPATAPASDAPPPEEPPATDDGDESKPVLGLPHYAGLPFPDEIDPVTIVPVPIDPAGNAVDGAGQARAHVPEALGTLVRRRLFIDDAARWRHAARRHPARRCLRGRDADTAVAVVIHLWLWFKKLFRANGEGCCPMLQNSTRAELAAAGVVEDDEGVWRVGGSAIETGVDNEC